LGIQNVRISKNNSNINLTWRSGESEYEQNKKNKPGEVKPELFPHQLEDEAIYIMGSGSSVEQSRLIVFGWKDSNNPRSGLAQKAFYR
jgi:hypothetical protein